MAQPNRHLRKQRTAQRKPAVRSQPPNHYKKQTISPLRATAKHSQQLTDPDPKSSVDKRSTRCLKKTPHPHYPRRRRPSASPPKHAPFPTPQKMTKLSSKSSGKKSDSSKHKDRDKGKGSGRDKARDRDTDRDRDRRKDHGGGSKGRDNEPHRYPCMCICGCPGGVSVPHTRCWNCENGMHRW